MLTIPNSIGLASLTLIAISASLALGQPYHEDSQFIPDNLPWGYSFGRHVSIDQGLFSTGAIYYDTEGNEYGAAYSFKLTNPSNGFELAGGKKGTIDSIGPRTVIKDGIVATGVVANADNGYTRSVHLYDANDGTLLRELSPGDTLPIHSFGRSLAINDGMLAVGAYYDDDNGDYSGSVYLYDINTGELLHKLIANDGMPSDYFGISVAIDNGLVAVGASGHDVLGPSSGAIYLFDAATGQQLHKFLADDGHISFGNLGVEVSMGNGIIAAGVSLDGENGSYAGALYLFDTTTGDQIAKVFPEITQSYDYFGSSVSISNGIIAVGAEGYPVNGQNRVGTAYLFDASTGTQIAQLLPNDPANSWFFGSSLSLDGSDLIVGSYGPVYIFNINTIVCPADLTGDGSLDFFDVSAFLSAFIIHDPMADFTDDGRFDFFDVSAFLDAFGTDC